MRLDGFMRQSMLETWWIPASSLSMMTVVAPYFVCHVRGCQIRKKALIILDLQDLLSQIPGTCSRFPRAVEDIRDVGVITTRNRGHDIVPS